MKPYFRASVGVFLLLSGLLMPSGCVELGAGGTGELRIDQARLRRIEPLRLEQLPSAGPAATQPLILPATAPSEMPTERPITLAEVRQAAIEGNLDLKVEL
ncbi:MAG: hypothetical protein RMJ35_14025, partial [Phycisphaerales bacterium]|nr:hypothetical protein [Phycisphaerales bacterium]